MKLRNFFAMVLLTVGSLQMAGYLTGSKPLRGIGLASGVAPFPKVFCETDGYEAFAATFRLEGSLPDGTRWAREIGPELYSNLKGPYNRRNVYGAALAFAPRLPQKLRDPLLREALSPSSRMRSELGIPSDLRNISVVITPREGENEVPWTYTPGK